MREEFGLDTWRDRTLEDVDADEAGGQPAMALPRQRRGAAGRRSWGPCTGALRKPRAGRRKRRI